MGNAIEAYANANLCTNGRSERKQQDRATAFGKQEMSEVLGTTHLPAQVNAQDKVCLVFAVENVEATCARLKAAGVQLAAELTDHPDWGIRTAHFRDPDGNLIEINQPLP